PSFCWSAASAGISLRHGTHQVAHRLRSTTLPRQSASVLSAPLPSLKCRSGRRCASLATLTAATSPCASGAIRFAVASAGPQAAAPALPPKPAIPYPAARPISTIAAAAIPAYRAYPRRCGAAAGVSTVGVWCGVLGVGSLLAVMIEQTVDV